ncbi:hypothetical protein GO755_00815 [Spirosoma sp. HMF4905]|uniref:Lipocalin-like domain-containing protein n=1 Tax=Spirosoma arboris TaxID=2682092 RepID=A0A7K1S400_9BACT|nr:DUF5004 domain-containing protein [Spirosoma arboris]MVM28553.1 hypothetical protein [Spirosoma arboris]
MKTNRILTTVILATVLLTACQKSSDSTPAPALTKAQMLVGGQWKIKALTASPAIKIGVLSVTDVLSLYPSCITDNFQTFSADGVYVFDEGTTKCDSSDPQRETGTWKLSADETQVILNMPSNSHEVWELPMLTSTQATTRSQMVVYGTTYTITASLEKVN